MQSCHNRWWKTIFKRKQTGQFLTRLPWRLLNRVTWCENGSFDVIWTSVCSSCAEGDSTVSFLCQTPAAQPFKSLLTLLLNMPLNWSTSCLFIHLHNADAVLPDLMFPSESWRPIMAVGNSRELQTLSCFVFLGEQIILENEKCHLCGLFQQRKTWTTFFFFLHHSHILENTFQYSNLYSYICRKCLAIKNV